MSDDAAVDAGYMEEEPPGFDPLDPLDPPTEELDAIDGQVVDEETRWEEPGIRSKLRLTGLGLHELFGRGHPKAFILTPDDLDRIAPPLTRILNRNEQIRMIAAASDPIDLALGTGIYAGRSVLQAAAAAADQREAREAAQAAQQEESREAQIVRDDHDHDDGEDGDEWTRPRHQRRRAA